MHAKWLLPNYWTFLPAQSLSLCVCVCVCVCALCMQRLPAASCWGLTKAKVPRCQVAVKLLLRARTQNRIEPNGMERNGTPNQIVIIRDGACNISILLWTKLSHRTRRKTKLSHRTTRKKSYLRHEESSIFLQLSISSHCTNTSYIF